ANTVFPATASPAALAFPERRNAVTRKKNAMPEVALRGSVMFAPVGKEGLRSRRAAAGCPPRHADIEHSQREQIDDLRIDLRPCRSHLVELDEALNPRRARQQVRKPHEGPADGLDRKGESGEEKHGVRDAADDLQRA